MELTSKVDHIYGVLILFGQVERMNEYRVPYG